MFRVAILTPRLSPGDAVSNDVLGMSEAFANRGLEARVYSGNSDVDVPNVFDLEGVHHFVAEPSDLLVYHHSEPWKPGLSLLRQATCRRAIKYHNLSQLERFIGDVGQSVAESRPLLDELKEIVRLECELYLADSDYGRQEIVLEGADDRRCFVVHPFHDIDQLQFAEANLKTLDSYGDGRFNFLTVGPLVPHQHDQMIVAFAIYLQGHNPNGRLLILGKEETAFANYSQRLRDLVAFLAIDDAVSFLGEPTLSERKACYLVSGALAVAGEHEGLYLPLLEAMSMKVPVVASPSPTISATLGEAGILMDKWDPGFMAEAMNCITRDETLSFELALRGCRRYQRHFTNQQIEDELFGVLEAVAE